MKIEQIYTGCIAQAAYYIESNGEAAIFDPLREVQPYLDRAQRDNAKIKYIFETHFHADFVSGHLDLSEKSGAQIVFGPTAKTAFKSTVAEDNQVFTIGNYTVKVIHTPGHHLESSCYFLFIDQVMLIIQCQMEVSLKKKIWNFFLKKYYLNTIDCRKLYLSYLVDLLSIFLLPYISHP